MKHEITSKRLQRAMDAAQINQRTLAEKANIKEASVSHYVNGSHAPSNLSANAMAKVLDVNPLWLMGFDVEMDATNKKKTFEVELNTLVSDFDERQRDRLLEYARLLKNLGDNNEA